MCQARMSTKLLQQKTFLNKILRDELHELRRVKARWKMLSVRVWARLQQHCNPLVEQNKHDGKSTRLWVLHCKKLATERNFKTNTRRREEQMTWRPHFLRFVHLYFHFFPVVVVSVSTTIYVLEMFASVCHVLSHMTMMYRRLIISVWRRRSGPMIDNASSASRAIDVKTFLLISSTFEFI